MFTFKPPAPQKIFQEKLLKVKIFKLVDLNLDLVKEKLSAMLYNSLAVLLIFVSATCPIGIGGVFFKFARKSNNLFDTTDQMQYLIPF